ncbi:enoyl-CoA hydratase/isomerase family protein [Sphingomonas sp.]|jgi:enoyl-CoA hydratase/carnithine racemase|uniref:enoyl-CoA hydratase/isomerase family protein n=1 Tax=Sphingomonas sp. TaxID=28214 RepID=UPI002DB99BA2|nr:enoyl-CoA hydratase/isomerase family protein [Sphingomonas sp.]HEU4969546.1 enoyl-CoA hydratase/isomerase family protein [Sphingomonas sp.]
MHGTAPGRKEDEEQPLLVSRASPGIAVLTLARPRVHNALNMALLDALLAEVRGAAADPDLRALVLTGTGASFCSGDDLAGLRASGSAEFERVLDALQSLTLALVDCPKPVIAALNGPAYGAGLELVLACDVRLATPFFAAATPEVRLGLVATNGATVLLPHLIGPSRARRMLLDGEPRPVEWCLRAGLVDALIAPERLVDEAVACAAVLSSGAPGAIAATRAMMNAPLRDALQQALACEKRTCLEARQSPDCEEGVRAFFERRQPRWGDA